MKTGHDSIDAHLSKFQKGLCLVSGDIKRIANIMAKASDYNIVVIGSKTVDLLKPTLHEKKEVIQGETLVLNNLATATIDLEKNFENEVHDISNLNYYVAEKWKDAKTFVFSLGSSPISEQDVVAAKRLSRWRDARVFLLSEGPVGELKTPEDDLSRRHGIPRHFDVHIKAELIDELKFKTSVLSYLPMHKMGTYVFEIPRQVTEYDKMALSEVQQHLYDVTNPFDEKIVGRFDIKSLLTRFTELTGKSMPQFMK